MCRRLYGLQGHYALCSSRGRAAGMRRGLPVEWVARESCGLAALAVTYPIIRSRRDANAEGIIDLKII